MSVLRIIIVSCVSVTCQFVVVLFFFFNLDSTFVIFVQFSFTFG